jgi:hypothetical protein
VSAYDVATVASAGPAPADAVTFWGEFWDTVRRGLPNALLRAAIGSAACVVGQLVISAGYALGVLS